MRRLCIMIAWLLSATTLGQDTTKSPTISWRQDDSSGRLAAICNNVEFVTYQYGGQDALPHFWPLRSPSGKLLTLQQGEPYPHHRSLWIADSIRAADGMTVDFYHWVKNYHDPANPSAGFRHFVRHHRFRLLDAQENRASVEIELRWVMDEARPVLDENRKVRLVVLEGGEYFVDLAWELRATYGPVQFVSDEVHYAWPYLRVHPQFSGEQGGEIVSSEGARGQAATDGRNAEWVDCYNTVDGVTEGIAMMVFPDGKPHRWLTRDYGTFGPRRDEEFSGTKFTLPRDAKLTGRVGILMHRGDVDSGHVAERYRRYCEARL